MTMITAPKENSRLFLFIQFLFPVALLVSVVFSQYYFDLEKGERPFIPPTILPAQAIKLGDLGLHSAAASLVWLYTIQNIPAKTPELIRIVNELDPKFSYPYAFAALTLPSLASPEEAVEIAERGIIEADPDWRIPYYLATTYHIFLEDRQKAALYFNIAANTPGAPEKIKSISARYGIDTDILEKTKDIWISIYETSNDETAIETAKKYIIHIEIIQLLEKATGIYKQRYGVYPKNLDDLVAKKILTDIPESPLRVEFIIRADGRITVR